MKTITAPDRSGELLRAGQVMTVTGNALVEWVGEGGVRMGPVRVVLPEKFGPFETDIQLIISAVDGHVTINLSSGALIVTSEIKSFTLNINRKVPVGSDLFDDTLVTLVDGGASWTKSGSGTFESVASSLHAKETSTVLKLAVPAIASQSANAVRVLPAPLNLSAADYFEFVCWFDEATSSAAPMTFQLITSSPGTADRYDISSSAGWKAGWNIFRIKKETFVTVGAANWADIKQVRFSLSSSASVARTAYIAAVRAGKLTRKRAALSLCFDDGYISAKYAAALAASRDIPMTFSFSKGSLLNPSTTHLSIAEARQLAEMGHELALDYVGVSFPDYIAANGYAALVDLLREEKAFTVANIGARGDLIMYPFGAYQPPVFTIGPQNSIYDAMQEVGIRYGRTTFSGLNTSGNAFVANYSPRYPQTTKQLPGGMSLANANNLAAVQARLDLLIEHGGWLNFYGHKLGETAADGITWAYADFVTLLDYIKTKRDAGLLHVDTLGNIADSLYASGALVDFES